MMIFTSIYGTKSANKALHWTPIPLRSIGASELGRYGVGYLKCNRKDGGSARNSSRYNGPIDSIRYGLSGIRDLQTESVQKNMYFLLLGASRTNW